MKITINLIASRIHYYIFFGLLSDRSKITLSGLFDEDWYVAQYPDVAASAVDPLKHYLMRGASEGRSPHPLFDPQHYISQAGARARRQPLLHFLTFDPRAVPSPHPLFDRHWYLEQYTDVANAGANPLLHYLSVGASEGRDPSPHFSTKRYLAEHPELRNSRLNPLVHYVLKGGPVQSPGQPGPNMPRPMDPKSRVISIDATDIATISINEPDGVVVIMPSINAEKARKTAEILLERSGVYTIIIVVNDSIRAGYISTLNATARQVNARYVAYVAEDAFPGLNWLSTAFERLEATGKGLLAFNCGKWRGRIAAFGLVRMSWIKPLYGGDIFFPGYKAHKADNEITVIARTQDQLVYEPDAVLVEVDPGKKFVETSVNDREIFRSRFRTGFDGKVPVSLLEPLAEAYFVKMHPVENERERGSTDATPSSGHPQRVTVQIPANSPLAARMVADAYQALSRGPYSVVDKTSLPPSGDAKDYWHPAPYWWPNPETRDGLPYIRRDGYRVPGTNLYEEGSERYDRSRIQRVFDDSAVLMLAYEVSKKAEFLDHAARILRVFFLDPSTAMNPHLKFGQVRMGHKNNQGNATAIIETKDLYFYLDAVRALIHSGGLTSAEERDFRAWLTAFLDWLLNSEQGRLERDAQNNHGICYDLQVGAIAAFLGLDEELALAARRAEGRLPQHFDVEGRQNNEINRTNSAHYCCFNMQSWVNMSEIAQRVGVDLWHTDVHGGINLGVGAKWLLTFMDRPWPFTQAEEFDRDRWLPILFAAQGAGVDGLPSPPPERRAPELVKPVFFPHDCIRPYWNVFTTTVRPSTPSGHQN